ncbi:MAG: hypothetical protein M3Q97_09800, partial [Bacteroidota bacterium]|nr:hypothetical protein [Bacteroidota bacterium]
MAKRYLFLFFLLAAALPASAQQELMPFPLTGSGLGTTLSTDYQALGLNPANLGMPWQRRIRWGFAEVGAAVYSGALNKSDIKKSFLRFGDRDTLTAQDKRNAARELAYNPIAVNVSFTSIGAGYQSDLLGGIAFSIQDKGGSYYY